MAMGQVRLLAHLLAALCVTVVVCEMDCTLSQSGQSEPGECTPLDACPAVLRRAKAGQQPQHCGFQSGSNVPVVCCPIESSNSTSPSTSDGLSTSDITNTSDGPSNSDITSTSDGPSTSDITNDSPSTNDRSSTNCTRDAAEAAEVPTLTCEQIAEEFEKNPLPAKGEGRVASKMCRKHLQDLCALSKLPLNAVCPSGGRPADLLEFPHMAMLGFGEREQIEYGCGGSLISPDFVLTAAHCAALDEKPVSWVLLGASNRSDADHTEDTRQLIAVEEVIVHPDYKPPRKYSDLALLRLSSPAKLQRGRVRPACLHTDLDDDHIDREAVASGWGATDFGEDGSERLLKVNLTVRDLQYCRDRIYLPADLAPRGLLDSHLCAGGGDDGNRDTCQGDSGGPLQVRVARGGECLFRILGVVSFGPPCGRGLPGIYTKVSAFVPWIESIVWPVRNESCALPSEFRDSITSSPTNRPVPVLDSGPGTRARRMCRFYLASFCQLGGYISSYMQPGLTPRARCHHRFSRTPGHDTGFRFGNSSTATLLYGEDYLLNEEYACSAILVSPQYVLTAAHCAKLGCLPVTMVRFGKPHSCLYYSTLYRVSAIHVHPKYDPAVRYNDIALIKVLGRLDWELIVDVGYFLPACLPTVMDSGDTKQSSLLAEGWQTHGPWDDLTYDFVSRNVSVQMQCAASYREAGAAAAAPDFPSRLPQGLADTHICAGGPCNGDRYPGNPGSPLLAPMFTLSHAALNRTYPVRRLVAVEAYSPPCGALRAPEAPHHLPDVFTSVTSFVPWIESVVWPDAA